MGTLFFFFSIFSCYCTKTRRMNENNEINWKELTDCKYFLTGRCNLNKKCLFRHCFQAKNTNQICYKWDKYQCLNSNCPFRHPNSLSDIQIIPTIVETVGTTTKESNHSISIRQESKIIKDLTPQISFQDSHQSLNNKKNNQINDNNQQIKQSFCLYFMRGKCIHGNNCKFLHERENIARNNNNNNNNENNTLTEENKLEFQDNSNDSDNNNNNNNDKKNNTLTNDKLEFQDDSNNINSNYIDCEDHSNNSNNNNINQNNNNTERITNLSSHLNLKRKAESILTKHSFSKNILSSDVLIINSSKKKFLTQNLNQEIIINNISSSNQKNDEEILS